MSGGGGGGACLARSPREDPSTALALRLHISLSLLHLFFLRLRGLAFYFLGGREGGGVRLAPTVITGAFRAAGGGRRRRMNTEIMQICYNNIRHTFARVNIELSSFVIRAKDVALCGLVYSIVLPYEKNKKKNCT